MRYYRILNNGEVVGYQTHDDKLNYDNLEELSEEEYNAEISLLREQSETENENFSSDEISPEEFMSLIEEAL